MVQVVIAWDDLIAAFSNLEQDKVYYFDRMTGDVFSVRSEQDQQVLNHLEQDSSRFLEIPCLDSTAERSILQSFLEHETDPLLHSLVTHALSRRPPFTNLADIISFFPEDESRMIELRDAYLSNRVKTWLEEHDLFSTSTSINTVH